MAKRQLNRRQNWRIERFKVNAQRVPPNVNPPPWKRSRAATWAPNKQAW